MTLDRRAVNVAAPTGLSVGAGASGAGPVPVRDEVPRGPAAAEVDVSRIGEDIEVAVPVRVDDDDAGDEHDGPSRPAERQPTEIGRSG